ncbi:ATP-dependent translocase ABCB1-like [Anneissia japonica]|uniref:ATP-dependent translocase ABCB1-like n=1 Tax=Anneissia japonica TaxID=1529436 RepID=UPI0014256217|nr:ATP-dependent translocase ABCB1-like [Anneissia japonica]
MSTQENQGLLTKGDAMGTDAEKQYGAISKEKDKLANGHTDSTQVEFRDGQEGGQDDPPQKRTSFFELFRYATWLDVMLMLLGTLFAIVHGAGWPFMMIIFGEMTNDFVDKNKNITLEDFENEITKYSIIYSYIGCAILGASFIQATFWSLSSERQSHILRKRFFRSILRQEIGWFDKHQSGELTTRLADDLERVKEGTGDKISFVMQFTSQLVAGFAIGFWKSWELTLVMMSFTPLLAICGAFMAVTITSFAKKEQSVYAAAGSVAEEVLSCIRTVVAFGGEQKETERYSKELVAAKNVGVKKGLTTALGIGLFMLILFCSYGLAFWYGPKMVSEDKIDPGEVLTVFFCVMIGSFSLGNITPHLSSVATARGAAYALFEIIDNVPSIDSSSDGGLKPASLKGNIQVKNVNFSYPTRPDVQVLNDISLEIVSGQTVALVGSSGCGKSTIVGLLQRFYDISGGQIFLDGVEIKDLNIKWLRQNVGVVSQEPVLFGCSIEENIRYGREGVTQNEIIQAAKSANAHDFISKLPKGYNTLVGERGAQLSGGQKQRVAIARALVRNPKILLLDEATSALDSESEKLVQEALDKAQEGRTVLVVAHRLSTIKHSDVIFALRDGQVVEHGSHDELMEKNGVYKQLVTLQMIEGAAEESVTEKSDIDKSEKTSSITRQISTKRQLSRQRSRVSSSASGTSENKEEEEKELETLRRICLLLLPLFAIFFGEIINVFSQDTLEEMQDAARFWSLMFVLLGVITGLGNFFQTWMFSISGENLTMRLRIKAFSSMLRQEMAWYDDPYHSTGALTTRLATDASNVKGATGIRIGAVLQSCVTMLAAVFIALYYGWKLALVMFGCLPFLALAGIFQMKAISGSQKADAELREDAGKTASESIENMRTVASLSLEDRFYDQYCKQLDIPFEISKRNSTLYGLSFSFSQGIMFFIYAAAFRFGGHLVAKGEMMPDEVFKVFFGISFAGISLGQSSAFIPDYTKAKYSTALLIKLFNTVPSIDSYSNAGLKPAKMEGIIEYKGIHFTYPSRPDTKILKGLDLTIEPGCTVALVGESGCGKSTLVSILERFYDPAEGQVLLDGSETKEYNIKWLRSQMSIVSQEPVLFDRTIKENIGYSVDTPLTDSQVEEVAKMANIHDFIISLPQGYGTSVGEKGTQLSGGQKQRVAIARALARNPRIILLDEATSALDSESEKIVQTALDRAMDGRTCIVIAHRLSTIQNADKIAVVEDGKIIEAGTHQELTAKKGHYFVLTGGQREVKPKSENQIDCHIETD